MFSDNRALSVLSLKSNKLGTKEAGEALGVMLKGNSLLKELDLSDNWVYGGDTAGFAQGISKGLPGNGALLHFDISNNDIRAKGGKALVEALKCNQVINTLSVAENNLSFNSSGDQDMSALVALADVIPGMGALIKLDIRSNGIGAEQEEDLRLICVAGSIELVK
jgi:Ran GTPase-activating protein (RanGAP) involved in mRNA processing and transport